MYESLRSREWGGRGKKSLPYLVIDVCNVHNKVDIKLEVVAHDAPNDIGADIVSGMAQMRIVVDCWSAHVPRDLLSSWVNRNKGRL